MKIFSVLVGTNFLPISAQAMGLGIEQAARDMSWYELALEWQRGIGAAIGLFALLLAALFNAWLNRRRDNKILRKEAQSLAIALAAEVKTNVKADQLFQAEMAGIAMNGGEVTASEALDLDYWMGRKPNAETFHDIGAKIGLLPPSTVDLIGSYYAALNESAELNMKLRVLIKQRRGSYHSLGNDPPVQMPSNKELGTMTERAEKQVKTGEILREELQDFGGVIHD